MFCWKEAQVVWSVAFGVVVVVDASVECLHLWSCGLELLGLEGHRDVLVFLVGRRWDRIVCSVCCHLDTGLCRWVMALLGWWKSVS